MSGLYRILVQLEQSPYVKTVPLNMRRDFFFLVVTWMPKTVKMNGSSFVPSLQLLLMLVGFSLPPVAETYGFNKCTQYEFDIHHVLCIRKKITNLTEAISDIPRYTTHLNLTHN